MSGNSNESERLIAALHKARARQREFFNGVGDPSNEIPPEYIGVVNDEGRARLFITTRDLIRLVKRVLDIAPQFAPFDTDSDP